MAQFRHQALHLQSANSLKVDLNWLFLFNTDIHKSHIYALITLGSCIFFIILWYILFLKVYFYLHDDFLWQIKTLNVFAFDILYTTHFEITLKLL